MTAVPMIDVTKEVLEKHVKPREPLRPISAIVDPNKEVTLEDNECRSQWMLWEISYSFIVTPLICM